MLSYVIHVIKIHTMPTQQPNTLSDMIMLDATKPVTHTNRTCLRI